MVKLLKDVLWLGGIDFFLIGLYVVFLYYDWYVEFWLWKGIY